MQKDTILSEKCERKNFQLNLWWLSTNLGSLPFRILSTKRKISTANLVENSNKWQVDLDE